MSLENFEFTGLTDSQVTDSRAKYGQNKFNFKRTNPILEAIKGIVMEPMVILLLVTSSIYFITGNTGDGLFLTGAIVLVAAISLIQDSKSRNAVEKLKNLAQPKCQVIRDGVVIEIKIEDVVVGDLLMIEEGSIIAADGIIIHSNDFSVNESILTGESFAVYKDKAQDNNFIYSGTQVVSGLAIVAVISIGNNTKLGKIGKSIDEVAREKSPLEIQIGSFVKKMVFFGGIVFVLVWGINYYNSSNLLDSLLKALTLAMSILPEEIPVAFTTFMAMGAWRLMKMGVIVKQMKTVESLGSATVICLDKTGTITKNSMNFDKLYVPSSKTITSLKATLSDEEKDLIATAMWASEPIPFDPMEQALHQAYTSFFSDERRKDYKMIHEYPLEGKPPMMTHIFEDSNGDRIIAAKGAPEAIYEASNLEVFEKVAISEKVSILGQEGYRVLGVGEAKFEGKSWPENQRHLNFTFKGLIAFYDPPKENIQKVLADFYDAGINIKIITGDIAATAVAVAKNIDFRGYDSCLSGEELVRLNDANLQEKAINTQLFTRMFPEAKLKIINVLKASGEIVAMTGDGVNDGPALKAAHIGVAMGKRGTEIAKASASLILVEDDLSKMVDAIAMGRKIYDNLKKAIQYIISIHIPIILTVLMPLVLGWVYPNIFSPIHVILLELIMGPTCSIVYENEPMEANTMQKNPRPLSATFFNWRELATSIFQGLLITIGTLSIYQFAVYSGYNEPITRTMVFTTLISANIFLTFVNRSFYYSVLTTLKYKNNLIPIMIGITIGITALLLFVHPLTSFFEFELLTFLQISLSMLVGFLSVIWYELIKWKKRLS